jgi:anaerobic magnesium-protoporphyrin IX monomethyl ester cyclase
MKRTDYKNLVIGIDAGYHTSVRLLHSMVKDKSDCSVLIFEHIQEVENIGLDLKVHYATTSDRSSKAFNIFRDWIKQEQFELIGISVMSHHWNDFVKMTDVIRETLPDCKIIAGGVHPWYVDPEGTLEHCDYICAAEGEDLYSKLIDALSSGPQDSPLLIDGLVEKFNGETIHTRAREESYMPIDDTPVPTVSNSEVYYLLSKPNQEPVFSDQDPRFNGEIEFIHAGRGCTFKCTFCINSVIEDPVVRVRSVDKVMEEIKTLLAERKFVTRIYFEDEIFPMKTKWVKEFSEKYKKEIGLPFSITIYPTMLNREKAEYLKAAGLVEVTMGFQSGSERIRKDVYDRSDKNTNIIKENAILSDLNILTHYDLIIENPFEEIEDLKESLEVVSNLAAPFYLKIYTIAYYPHHPLTEKALREKKITIEDVDPMIGYLSVATPHKIALSDHLGSGQPKFMYIWHNKLRARMLSGLTKNAYYLLISYYGYWFLPRFLLNIVKSNFLKGRKGPLIALAFAIDWFLLARSTTIVNFQMRALALLRRVGVKLFLQKVWLKITTKLYPREKPVIALNNNIDRIRNLKHS